MIDTLSNVLWCNNTSQASSYRYSFRYCNFILAYKDENNKDKNMKDKIIKLKNKT